LFPLFPYVNNVNLPRSANPLARRPLARISAHIAPIHPSVNNSAARLNATKMQTLSPQILPRLPLTKIAPNYGAFTPYDSFSCRAPIIPAPASHFTATASIPLLMAS
jgi:hypothetical protein